MFKKTNINHKKNIKMFYFMCCGTLTHFIHQLKPGATPSWWSVRRRKYFTLFWAKSSFCWRSEQTEVTSGSSNSSQSTNSPEHEPGFFDSVLPRRTHTPIINHENTQGFQQINNTLIQTEAHAVHHCTAQMFGVGKIFWKTSLMLIKADVSYAHSFISQNSVKTVTLHNIII